MALTRKVGTGMHAVAGMLLAMACLIGPQADALAQTGQSPDLKSAQAALAAGDYATAYPVFLQAAQQGDALAGFTVGLFHRAGWGRQANAAESCRWFERAAAGKIPAAAHFLANCLLNGNGMAADPARAAQWYRRAAELGHHASLCNLADLHMDGRGVPENPELGLAMCRQAAELGSLPAAIKVGRYLLEGKESIRDPAAAHDWFMQAAGRQPEADYYLGLVHRDGLGQPANPDEARYWFESAAAGGYVAALYPTAELYLQPAADLSLGRPPAGSLAKGYMWLRVAQERSRNADERRRAQVLLQNVQAIMPASWRPELDAKIAAYLETQPALYGEAAAAPEPSPRTSAAGQTVR